ncbi:AfsR/SARP family transcriptional regulator [Nonomuraea sp. NPDC003804]|uniref:AfsR/SARP family transcriptional regulator n=1 Tax=Nonomuraea sp. NPDC003804 TaxID=3154547 RepID=UPI00339EC889
MIEFRVLGPVAVCRDRLDITPRAARLRQVLSLLLLQGNNQAVPLDALVDELWGERTPKTAVTTAQTYVYRLRTLLGRARLVTTPHGYLLRAEEDTVDATLFHRRLDEGHRLLEEGDRETAARTFRQALDLWTGAALATVAQGRALQAHAVFLEEKRLHAYELVIQTELELGLHRQLVGELRGLVTTHPLNEWFHAQLITALHRSGRRSEALLAYEHLRAVLDSELGVDPSPEVERVQREVLSIG